MPEVSTGLPSPPRSPPLAAAATENEARSQQQQQQQQQQHQQQQRIGLQARNGASFVGGGIAYHITEECERLFCERLRSTFPGERRTTTTQDSLVMGVHHGNQARTQQTPDHLDGRKGADASREGASKHRITKYLEMFDYRGDMGIRGFVSENAKGARTMFVFFESNVAGKDLKAGMMAVLELAYEKAFECSEMVVCLSRAMSDQDLASTTRDLGWVGFELTTLEPWSRQFDDTSQDWILLAMET